MCGNPVPQAENNSQHHVWQPCTHSRLRTTEALIWGKEIRLVRMSTFIITKTKQTSFYKSKILEMEAANSLLQ